MTAKQIEVTLPFHHDTPGALVFKTEGRMTDVPIGQVYVRKDHVDTIDGAWPSSVTVTVEMNK
jgi:hypothetical protein